jgi:hypothetical protein
MKNIVKVVLRLVLLCFAVSVRAQDSDQPQKAIQTTRGSVAANQSLSEKRAQAVVAWLSGHGVAAGR